MAPFYGWGSTASKIELLWGGSLLFTKASLYFKLPLRPVIFFVFVIFEKTGICLLWTNIILNI